MLFRKDHRASTLPPLMVMLKHSDEDGINPFESIDFVLTVINNGQPWIKIKMMLFFGATN